MAGKQRVHDLLSKYPPDLAKIDGSPTDSQNCLTSLRISSQDFRLLAFRPKSYSFLRSFFSKSFSLNLVLRTSNYIFYTNLLYLSALQYSCLLIV
jgi:hypothetical protein